MNRIEERSLQSKVLATAAAVALAMVLGALDYFTGREWAISAFYLLPTCVAAWMAGRWAGFAVGGFVHRRVVLQRCVQRRNISVSADSRLERDHAFYILLVVVWLLTAFQQFSLPPGANSRAANSRAADGDGRTKTAGTG